MARYTPQLSADQLQALPALLQNAQPWNHPKVVHAKPLHKQYGIGGRFLAAELLSKEIAMLISVEFGLTFAPEPTHLTDLGEKLLGLKRW